MRKRVLTVLAWVAFGALLFPALGCGGSDATPTATPTPIPTPTPTPNNWNQMLWNQGRWQ